VNQLEDYFVGGDWDAEFVGGVYNGAVDYRGFGEATGFEVGVDAGVAIGGSLEVFLGFGRSVLLH